MATTLLLLGFLYFLAHGMSLAYPRTRIPDVLLLMLIGILLGPVFRFLDPAAFGMVGGVLTTIALTVMLFEGGTVLDLGAVVRSARGTLVLTFGSAALTCGLTAALFMQFSGTPTTWDEALLVGAIICGTSSAVVLPMVKSLGLRPVVGTALVMESALTDVICIVLTVGLLAARASGTLSTGSLAMGSLTSLGLAALVGHIGGIAWLWLWESARKLPSALFTTLAFAFILYGVAELLGYSGAIASLTFGLSLANSQRVYLGKLFKRKAFPGITTEEKNFYGEVVFILKTFFFLYLGISMDFGSWDGSMVLMVILLILLIYTGRALLCNLAFSTRTTTRSEASIASVMAPKGLAAAVLATLPIQAGVPNGERIQSVIYAVILVSITATAVMAMVHDVRPFSLVPRYLLARFPGELPAIGGEAPPPFPAAGIPGTPAPATSPAAPSP